MSCNGCRVLRKGCSESCILRPCLQWIDSPEAQGHATAFVSKFFGRAGLKSFISAVPESQRPGIGAQLPLHDVLFLDFHLIANSHWFLIYISALFQSLLFEACGRTVNPVNGAVGLLWTGNWRVCQAAVETVLRGGTLRAMPELMAPTPSDETSEATIIYTLKLQETSMNLNSNCRFSCSRSKVSPKRIRVEEFSKFHSSDLDLRLTPRSTGNGLSHKRRPGNPSLNSEESVTTTCFESGFAAQTGEADKKLLNLFV
ncbi:LOB domain-containing protein 38 [Hibiscus syriacus]|uniref:LOB domain-containing protein 38 n=1 Tax=Hibiscus syriacus TaxID=106335 RepID=A0A6A3AL69_HIBSY|nr:LOB domain-containing protein 38 [Hibiscus syriacus]